MVNGCGMWDDVSLKLIVVDFCKGLFSREIDIV
jgi:hypothetical protein